MLAGDADSVSTPSQSSYRSPPLAALLEQNERVHQDLGVDRRGVVGAGGADAQGVAAVCGGGRVDELPGAGGSVQVERAGGEADAVHQPEQPFICRGAGPRAVKPLVLSAKGLRANAALLSGRPAGMARAIKESFTAARRSHSALFDFACWNWWLTVTFSAGRIVGRGMRLSMK